MDAVTLVLALKKSKAYTDAAIAAIAKGMEYKGSVATVSDLPAASSSNKGWLYTVTANSHEYVSDGTQWVDLSADVPAPGSSSPVMDGTASAGSASTYSRSDHVHPSDTAKVDKNQGVAHAGEFLVVGADGNITTQTVPNANGVSF